MLDEFKNFTMRLHSLGEQINNKTTCLQKEAENCKKVNKFFAHIVHVYKKCFTKLKNYNLYFIIIFC